jgi:hypothetical protein
VAERDVHLGDPTGVIVQVVLTRLRERSGICLEATPPQDVVIGRDAMAVRSATMLAGGRLALS